LVDTVNPEYPDEKEIFPKQSLQEIEDEFFRDIEMEPQPVKKDVPMVPEDGPIISQITPPEKRGGIMTRSRRRQLEEDDDGEENVGIATRTTRQQREQDEPANDTENSGKDKIDSILKTQNRSLEIIKETEEKENSDGEYEFE